MPRSVGPLVSSLLVCSSLLPACGGGAEDPTPAPIDASTADTSTDATLDAAPSDTSIDDTRVGDASDGASTEVATDAGSGLLGASASCTAKGDACAKTAIDPRTFASFRKDRFLPKSKYDEPLPDPLAGGRFQLAGVAKVSGNVTDVTFDGKSGNTLLDSTDRLEWFHVQPRKLVAGEPVWVAFHSTNAALDSGSRSMRVVVKTDAGDALDYVAQANPSDVQVTYVTTNAARNRLFVHLRNEGTTPRTIAKLFVDGRDVLASDVACLAASASAPKTLAPKSSVLVTVPSCKPRDEGSPWTVVAELADGGAAVGVGRVIRPRFPIEAWPNGSDCPVPGGDATNLDRHLSAAFDTFYLYAGSSACGTTTKTVVNDVAPKRSDYWALLGDDIQGISGWQTMFTDVSRVTGFLLGDEVDGELYLGDGSSKPAKQMRDSLALWAAYPSLPTYIGSKTNRNVGAFAGSADIQGSDFYVAACAPHITAFLKNVPIDGAYDYLKNVRDNHMPNTTWFYAQGLHKGWNKKVPVTGAEIVLQPDPQEILAQGFSVFAAGGKGIMWFQSDMAEATRVKARWDAIGYVNSVARALRERLRTGDLVSGVTTTGQALVDAIRAEDALLVPIVATKTTKAPTDAECGQAQIGLAAPPHWAFASQTLDVSVEVPESLAVTEVFEVTGSEAKLVPVTSISVSGRTLTIKGLVLDNTTPARMLVLSGPGVRDEVSAALKK